MIDFKVIFCWIIRARSLIKLTIKVHRVFIKNLQVATLIPIIKEFNNILIMSPLRLIKKKIRTPKITIRKITSCPTQFSKYTKTNSRHRKLVGNRLYLIIKLNLLALKVYKTVSKTILFPCLPRKLEIIVHTILTLYRRKTQINSKFKTKLVRIWKSYSNKSSYH